MFMVVYICTRQRKGFEKLKLGLAGVKVGFRRASDSVQFPAERYAGNIKVRVAIVNCPSFRLHESIGNIGIGIINSS